MKTIYNTYILLESQEQCDRMKQLCIDNGLPIWNFSLGFKIFNCDVNHVFCFIQTEFFISAFDDLTDEKKFNKVTEQEFIKLLNQKI